MGAEEELELEPKHPYDDDLGKDRGIGRWSEKGGRGRDYLGGREGTLKRQRGVPRQGLLTSSTLQT